MENKFKGLHDSCQPVVKFLLDTIAEGPDRDMALVKLQECIFWSERAIRLQEQPSAEVKTN